MKCSKCGMPLPEKAKFCPQCGHMVQLVPHCINGHSMQPGQKFCIECGAPLAMKEDPSDSICENVICNPSASIVNHQREKVKYIKSKKISKFWLPFCQSLITLGILLLILVFIQKCESYRKRMKLQDNGEYVKTEVYDEVIEDKINKGATSGIINGHEWVDLGLPSGLKWATCNVGASTPSDFGNYYSWGETTTKSSYDTLYFTRRMSDRQLRSAGIINSLGNLRMDYDAARYNWGGSWRMPTEKECKELRSECDWHYCVVDGVGGYQLTGPNGCTIFIPNAGVRSDHDTFKNKLLRRAGTNLKLWSSTSGGDEHAGFQNIGQAYAIDVEESRDQQNYIYRHMGLPIRAVSE